MNRRNALVFAAAAVGTAVAPRQLHAQSNDFESTGVGLPFDDFDELFGPGEAGQTYMSYALPDGNYWVGVDQQTDVVDYIERNWSEPSGAPLEKAVAEAQSLLPADARLVEQFNANYAQILHATQVDRYTSRSLGDQFSEDRAKLGRNFTIIYEKGPAPAEMAFWVTRWAIVVAQEPED